MFIYNIGQHVTYIGGSMIAIVIARFESASARRLYEVKEIDSARIRTFLEAALTLSTPEQPNCQADINRRACRMVSYAFPELKIGLAPVMCSRACPPGMSAML